ncbi:hypothetical protein CDD81_4502 [Ophiocordyceps australis]|uniref:Uncharacterized protein n=1 Tax=Ophiocordyceps australis TaxID=1399860 RepID=A0A2C5YEF4_9HYPO|nr:hypothetical protein CDD81_4502 [Ophiocordyceps australis]
MSHGVNGLARGALRVPQRQSRRQSRYDGFGAQYVLSPGCRQADNSSRSSSGAADEKHGGYRASMPGRTGEDEAQMAKELQRWADESMETHKPLMAAQMDPDKDDGRREERAPWYAHRSRACRFLTLVGVGGLILVALVVGLSVGLKDRGTPVSTSDGLNKSNTAFPVGTFSLQPRLIHRSNNCVSRPSAWRCGSADDAPMTLHITVSAPDADHFSISSKPSSYFPTLTDVAMGRMSTNEPDERLVFTVPLNMTIDSAGVRCTIQDVRWSAALYTKRRGEQDVAMSVDVKVRGEVEWPGDAQLAFVKASTATEHVVCGDEEGRRVDGQVEGTRGTCECIYSNDG